ncbi:hypothetical protein [Neobacillus sp. Marseille-QA0830]
MAKNVLSNRLFIVVLLLMFIFLYAFFYERSTTGIFFIYRDLEQTLQSSFSEAELNKIQQFFQMLNSMYFQIPVQFINTLFNLYVTSFILYVGLRVQKRWKKKSLSNLSYSDIITVYYTSLYAVMLNFAIQVVIMISTHNTVDILDNRYYLPYWGLFTLLQVGIIIYGLFKKYRVLLFPVILYSLIFLVQLCFQWII